MAKATVYIEKELITHLTMLNDLSRDLLQFDFAVLGGISCVTDDAIADAASGSCHVEDGMVIQISGFVTGELTFGTKDAPVYWKPSTGEFSDTSTATYYKVGIVNEVKDSSGAVRMTMQKYAELIS